MTGHVLSDKLHEAALLVIAHDAVSSPERAVWALRNSGFTSAFLGIFLEEILERAREMGNPLNYSAEIVRLNAKVH